MALDRNPARAPILEAAQGARGRRRRTWPGDRRDLAPCRFRCRPLPNGPRPPSSAASSSSPVSALDGQDRNAVSKARPRENALSRLRRHRRVQRARDWSSSGAASPRKTRRIERVTAPWQMPQGGIDKGEDAAATRRIANCSRRPRSARCELLAEAPGWIYYDLPDEALGIALKGKYRGQRQRWFAYPLHRHRQRDQRHRTRRWQHAGRVRPLALGAARPAPRPDRAVQEARPISKWSTAFRDLPQQAPRRREDHRPDRRHELGIRRLTTTPSSTARRRRRWAACTRRR